MKNPTKTIKMKNNWTIQELASVAGVSKNAAYDSLHGVTKKINNNVLKAMVNMGYDSKEIKKQYQEFRKSKQEELIQTAK